jgi:hypothetical protein
MASAITLIDGGTTHLDVHGYVLEGLVIEPRPTQRKTTKFWGVNNESQIYGGRGGRNILVPVIVFKVGTYTTAALLADYINATLNGSALGTKGILTITSLSNHSAFDDTTYDGFALVEGPKQDVGGTLGGQYWAIGQLLFRQLS